MPGPRQAPTSPLEESPLIEQYQTWYSGGSSGSSSGGTGREQQQQQQQQKRSKDDFIGTTGRHVSLLTPHSPASDAIALTERPPRRSLQRSPSFKSAANSVSGEAENIAVFSNSSGNLQRAPSAPVARYNSQHTNTSDMHVPSDKGRHPHHYKPPPAHSYVRSLPARASGGLRQQPFSSPSPSLSTPFHASAAVSSIRHLTRQSPYTTAAPSSAAGLPADNATATGSGSSYRSTSSLYNQAGQPSGGRCSTSGIYQSTTIPAASQQNSTTNGRSMLHQQQHSSSSLSSSSSSPSTSSTLPSSLTTNSQLTARQPPHTKMQYHYYQQQPPPQNGLSGYHHHHQATHSQPPPPFTQLYSMTRLGHVGSIANKLGHGVGSGSSGLSGSGRPLTAEEKEMKRKVSHSAIEKRRRERTNAVLRELQTIVPGLSKPGKIQKLEILEAAADYIRQLTTTAAPESMTISAARTKQRRGSRNYHRMFYQQEVQNLNDYNAASRRDQPPDNATERPALLSPKTIDEQHMAVATPVSVSSTASNNDDADVDDDDDSADEDGAALAERVDACRGSEIPPSDPASMKVTFLLC